MIEHTASWLRERQDAIRLFGIFFVGAAGLTFLILEEVVGVALAPSMAAAIVVGLGVAAVLQRFVLRSVEKRTKPLRIEEQPGLGTVRIFRDQWVASVSLPSLPKKIEVSGESHGGPPTPEQLEIFREICDRYPSLLEASVSALQRVAADANVSLGAQDLQLTGISIESAPTSKFSLYFDVPGQADAFLWGLYVDFVSFSVEEAGMVD